MFIKTNLNKFRILYYNFKSMGLSYLIPIIAIFVYIPVMLYLFYLNGNNDIDYAKYSIYALLQQVIPFFSIWWLIFSLREYIEGKSSELLKVYKKTLTFDSTIILLWYILHIALIIFILSVVLNDNLLAVLVLLIIQSTAFYSVAYFSMILCRTISIPLITATVYEILYMYMDINFANLNILYKDSIENEFGFLIMYVPVLIGSVLLFCFSNLIYRQRTIR